MGPNENENVEEEVFLPRLKNEIRIIPTQENNNKNGHIDKRSSLIILDKDTGLPTVKLLNENNLKTKLSYKFLIFGDVILSSAIVCVLVVFFWRGLFGIVEIYLELWQLYLIHIVGCLLHVFFGINKRYIANHYKSKWCIVLYNYIFGVACVLQWSGIWYLMDYYFEDYTVVENFIVTMICVVLVLFFKLTSNLLAPPYVVAMDRSDTYCEFPSMFEKRIKTQESNEMTLYVLDCFFSVFVVGSLVVFVWRGVWCLTDLLLYPDDMTMSSFGSLVIGYILVIITFGVQTPMKRVCERLQGVWRLCVADVYIFISFIGTIHLWRGIWNLLNVFFLPDRPAMSCWITHFAGFIFLVLINCSNSILVRGVYIDAEEEGGKCVVFPTYYLRIYFQEKRKRKLMSSTQQSKVNKLANNTEGGEKMPKEKVSNNITSNKGHITMEIPPESTL